MLKLLKFLMNWEHKTPLIAGIMAFITFATGEGGKALFSHDTILIADFIGGALVILGKWISPTGSLPKGWNAALWATNIGALLLELIAYFNDSGLFGPHFAILAVQFQAFVTGLIGAFQVYFALKDQGTPTAPVA